MRLLRSKVYRAFPELDRFTDDQCARFVIAANSSWRRRLIRWILIALAGVLGVIIGGAAIVAWQTWIENGFRAGTTFSLVIGILLGITALGQPLIVALIFKDYLLRRSIRKLIRRCGSCPKCHYSLLGMRVSAENTIICPECGTKVDVDPSLGELSTDETGAAVFKPEVAREQAATVARRKRRHRAFFKWSAISAATFLLLLAAAYGVWWLVLVEQAKTARAERNTTKLITGLRDKMWPGGPQAESGPEWAAFLAVVKEVKERESRFASSENYRDALGRSVYFDWNAVAPGASVEKYEKNGNKGSFEPTRRLVLDAIEESRQAGTTERLKTILTLHAPSRPLVWDESHPFFGYIIDGMADARSTARFNAARMALALTNGDRAEYVEALEEILAISRIVQRQGLLIEQLVGYAIDALVTNHIGEDMSRYPDARWSKDVLDVMLRHADRPTLAQSLELERVGGVDALQWFFGDAGRVRNAQFGLAANDDIFVGGGRALPGSIGGYAGNKAAMNRMYDGWIAIAKREPGAMPVPSNTGYPVVDLVSPALAKAITSEQRCELDFHRSIFALAVQVRRMETGEYPKTFDEVASLVLNRELLKDPMSGKDFWFVTAQVKGENRTVINVMTVEDDPAAKPGGASGGAAKKIGP